MSQSLLMILLILATLTLVVYEFIGIYNARKKGLTKNKSRIITHGIMIILLLLLLFIVINFVIKFIQITKSLY